MSINGNSTDMTVERIYQAFQQSVEAKMHIGEALAPLIAQAGQRLGQTLLNEKKILVCGNGMSYSLAQMFTSSLLDRFEKERPGLPAVLLGSNVASYTAIASDLGFSDVYAKPVRALGNTGDILVVITTSGNPNNLIQAVAAAHERQMSVIALTGRDGGGLSTVLSMEDIEVCAQVHSRARIHEVHLLSLFCLCDLIDNELFGIS